MCSSFSFSQNDISGTINDAKTYLRFPLEKEEQLYGFGLNFQTVHQRGKILQLHMDHYGGKDNGRTMHLFRFMFHQRLWCIH
jgi:alpha-D-xyloside xylohydrolase